MNFTALYMQIIIMFLLILLGAFCYRRGVITQAGSRDMSTIMLTFVAPCVIIESFCRPFDPEMLHQLTEAFLLSVFILLVSILAATLVCPRTSPDYADKRMNIIFSNNGFMALPLLTALFGADGVFLGSINIVATNIFIWTYGVGLLSRVSSQNGERINWRKILLNPGTVGFFIGLLIFLTPMQLPQVFADVIGYIADLNTPVAMLILGVYLAQANLRQLLLDRAMYLVCFFRLVGIPALAIVLMRLLPFDPAVTQVIMVSVATPCAIASSMFAQMYHTNYRYSSGVIACSTLLSAISIPVMIAVYQWLAA